MEKDSYLVKYEHSIKTLLRINDDASEKEFNQDDIVNS